MACLRRCARAGECPLLWQHLAAPLHELWPEQLAPDLDVRQTLLCGVSAKAVNELWPAKRRALFAFLRPIAADTRLLHQIASVEFLRREINESHHWLLWSSLPVAAQRPHAERATARAEVQQLHELASLMRAKARHCTSSPRDRRRATKDRVQSELADVMLSVASRASAILELAGTETSSSFADEVSSARTWIRELQDQGGRINSLSLLLAQLA